MRKKCLGLLMLLAMALPLLMSHLAIAQEQGTRANGSAAAEGPQPGLLSVDLEQSILVLVIFIVLVFILYKTAWKNVLTGLKGREARIRNDIATAEDARKKAEAALVEYNTQLSTAGQRPYDARPSRRRRRKDRRRHPPARPAGSRRDQRTRAPRH